MRPLSLALTLALFCTLTASAQERLSRQEALKYAFFASLDLKQMTDTPVPTDPDPKRPLAIRHGDHGLLLLPEAKLNLASLTNVSKNAVPIGQLWLVKVAPHVDQQPVPAAKLRMIEVKTDSGQGTAACCALAARRNSQGQLELLLFGKSAEPLLTTPLKEISGHFDPELPLDILPEHADNAVVLKLQILGKLEAAIPVGEVVD